MRTRKIYANGQKRGGTPGGATPTDKTDGRKKDYIRQCLAFHGGDMAYERWVKEGRKGYGSRG